MSKIFNIINLYIDLPLKQLSCKSANPVTLAVWISVFVMDTLFTLRQLIVPELNLFHADTRY